jgi:hypothetical protein
MQADSPLYLAMSQQMAARMPLTDNRDGFGPRLLSFNSSFQSAAAMLARLGLGEFATHNGVLGFRPMPKRRRRQGSAPTTEALPSLAEVFAAWIALFGHFGITVGQHAVPTTRRPFVPAPEFGATLAMLADAGYLTRDGETYQWTDKAQPAMRAAELWGFAGESYNDMDEESFAEEATRLLADVPSDLMLQMKTSRSLSATAMIITLHWKGSAWGPRRRDGRGLHRAFELAAEVNRRLGLPDRQ